MTGPKAGSFNGIRAVPINGALDEEQCAYCPWFEWDAERSRCHNRGEFICWLYLSEVFGRRHT